MKSEDRDPASPTNWSQEIDSSSDLQPLQSFSSEESTPEALHETTAGSASLNQQAPLDQSPDSSTETTTITQSSHLIYIPESDEFQGLSNYENSSYPPLTGFDQHNQRIDSSDNNQFPDQLDIFSHTESKPINAFSNGFHEFSNQNHYNLNSNYHYFPVSNPTASTTFPLSIIHHDENLINNLSTQSTLAPLLSPNHGENTNHNYLNHHSMNEIPCVINHPASLMNSYYGPYQSSSPTSHLDRSFPAMKSQSLHPNNISPNLSHGVGLLYHPNSHHHASSRIYDKIEEVDPRTVSPLILPHLNTNLLNHNTRIDGSSSTASDHSVYDRLSSAGSCQASRAGSESFSRSNPSDHIETNHLHHHDHHHFDLNKENHSILTKKESILDQNEAVDPIQRNELISNAVQHLTTQVPRRRLTIEQEQVLLKRFSIQEYLSKREMEELAESLKIPTSQLRTWFGNRRSKLKAAARQRAKLEAGMGHLSDAELKSLNKRINGSHPKSKASTSR